MLSRLQDRESFSIIQADLGDEDAEVRGGAIRLIGDLGLEQFLPNILDRLQKLYGREQSSSELQFTLDVFYALRQIGGIEIAEELARKFEQLTERVRSAALEVIAARGSSSGEIDGFFQGLLRTDTPYPKLRAQAVGLYGMMASSHPNPKSLVTLIRKCLKDGDARVAAAAAEALATILKDRVFELPELRTLPAGIQAELISTAPSVPSTVLEEALKSDQRVVQAASVQRILSSDHPASAVRDVIRVYSADMREEVVVADRLMASLGRWNDSKQDRMILVQAFLYILKRHGGILEKFLPAPGTVLGEMDRLLARLRRAMLRTGTEKIQDDLLRVLADKAPPGSVFESVDEILRRYPKEKELRPVIQDVLNVADDRIRKRIATEVRAIPAGAFMPIKKILKVLPPFRETALIAPLRLIKDLAKYHEDADLEWITLMHLAGAGEMSALAGVCDAILFEESSRSSTAPQTTAPGVSRALADVTPWIRAVSISSTSAKVRETLLALIRRSTHPGTFRAAVEVMSAKVDAEVSNILMLRLPSLKGAMRFVAIQAIGRMGDRIHLPVFLTELRAPEEDRQLAGLLGLEKLFDANSDLPPDTVTAPLYELHNHPSRFVRAASIGLLVRLNDDNRVDLVSELISTEGPIPVGAYRLVTDLMAGEISDEIRTKLFQSLMSRIGRMTDDEEAVCEAFRTVLAGRPFVEFLKPQRQRADDVQDLKEMLRHRTASKATTDYQIAKSIRRRAITFLDITGFTPRAARMTAIELGFFLVQVEDEVMPFIENHDGTLVKRLGDGFLVSFPNSTHALASALEMLHYLAQKNQLLQEEDRVRLRAGIHVGDVLVDRDDVFGDTVNVAARVEAMAKPMCICFTEDVFREIPRRNEAIEYMGPTKLKGKDEPIPLYRIRLDVIYEAQTEAIQNLMAAPDWLPKIQRLETEMEERYQRLKDKIDDAKHMVEHGDFTHAEALVDEIEKEML